jgi:hypothetical protein
MVFLVARDLNSYIISGAALVGIDYMYKHNNAIVAGQKQLDAGPGPSLSGGAYPLPG